MTRFPPLPERVKIRGVWWRIARRRLPKNGGSCRPDLRLIIVHADYVGWDAWEVLIHEILHACRGRVRLHDGRDEEKLIRSVDLPLLQVIMQIWGMPQVQNQMPIKRWA